MSTTYISDTIKTYSVNSFKNIFALPNPFNVGLIFIGKADDYSNVQVIDTITDTIKDEKTIWDNMIAAKIIDPGDVELVIPRHDWSANTNYKQYDDTVKISELAQEDIANSIKPFYVINSEGDVYKCLSNNYSANSTVEPIGNYTSSNGFIYTTDDYVWKYMYNIKTTNRFLTQSWMPVPYSALSAATATDYDMSSTNLVEGTINSILVTNSGSGYFHKTHTYTYTNNASFLVATDISNVATGMIVTGSGIIANTYITSVDVGLNRVFLSKPTIGSGNTFNTITRVEIVGDGTDAFAEVQLSGDSIEKIIIVSPGINYLNANVNIYGTSNTATARAILPNKFGHGYSPAVELYAKDMMIVKRIGEVDSSVGGKFPTDISFRQYGILMNPVMCACGNKISYSLANSTISQTTDVTVADGLDYEQNEYVYQGTSINNSTFKGLVVTQSNNVIRLSNVTGVPDIGALLKGSTVFRPVVSYKEHQLREYSGNIVYVNNVDPIERADGQAEELKFIIKF